MEYYLRSTFQEDTILTTPLAFFSGDIQCTYELGLRILPDHSPALTLRICESILPDLEKALAKPNFLMEHYSEGLELKAFEYSSDPQATVGFSNAGYWEEVKYGFTELVFPIPRFITYLETACRDCNGTGKSLALSDDNQCAYCRGQKKNSTSNVKALYPVAASLSILFQMLQSLGNRKISVANEHILPQLINLQTLVQPIGVKGLKTKGNPISGTFMPTLSNWIGRQKKTSDARYRDTGKIPRAMRYVYSYMLSIPDSNAEQTFAVHMRKKYYSIRFCCLDNGCMILGDPINEDLPNLMLHFKSYNVESVLQQLTLLSGLATLHKIARIDTELSQSAPEQHSHGLRRISPFNLN